ncbi:zinc ABC transporter substrate-binding protein [Marivita sp. GX14005]|uniref:zinc ABC transporter substrate-binding protein n=1 Tax=Marivita sp. GX14005 TaxID=2942276 RepID=UPI0020193677|nr:zinc ABC transporter substrate-binding protein [Marivita sp. GX14005]MCL3881412.1 zinc ABC transporter substrate-binding protein [Marivita sp. GX14005]
MPRIFLIAFAALAIAQSARAEVPRVVADIAPVHSLVAMVMDGIGTPDLLIEQSAGPHTNAMRPSAAASLQNADLVVWIGKELSPWLTDPLGALAGDAERLALLDLEDTRRHAFRAANAFASGEHGDHAGHGHDGHADEDHSHDGVDPHAWLDPANARQWLTHIARVLSKMDPANARAYEANAARGAAMIADAADTAQAMLAPVQDWPFVVFHDAYQYFEHGFGLRAIGALALGDAVPPGPSRIARIREEIREQGVVCVFSEPQFSDRLVRTVIDGTDARIAELDPLGAALDPGAALYPALILDMAERFRTCLQ